MIYHMPMTCRDSDATLTCPGPSPCRNDSSRQLCNTCDCVLKLCSITVAHARCQLNTYISPRNTNALALQLCSRPDKYFLFSDRSWKFGLDRKKTIIYGKGKVLNNNANGLNCSCGFDNQGLVCCMLRCLTESVMRHHLLESPGRFLSLSCASTIIQSVFILLVRLHQMESGPAGGKAGPSFLSPSNCLPTRQSRRYWSYSVEPFWQR